MQYDLNKELKDSKKVKLTWHGSPTRLLIDGEHTKTDVNTGDTVSVSVAQARVLLKMYRLWTLVGDEPVEKPKAVEAPVAAPVDTLVPKKVETMTKEDVMQALKEKGLTFNDKASLKDLKGLLLEKLA